MVGRGFVEVTLGENKVPGSGVFKEGVTLGRVQVEKTLSKNHVLSECLGSVLKMAERETC